MIKIGDKVKFDSYLIHNYMNNSNLKKTLGNKEKISRALVYKNRIGSTTVYSEPLIQDKELGGMYVGKFNKKLVRKYNRIEQNIIRPDVDTELVTGRRLRTTTIEKAITDYHLFRTRPSKNPRRIDDPRSLSSIAMIKFGRKLIGVPMANLYKCNYGNIFRTI